MYIWLWRFEGCAMTTWETATVLMASSRLIETGPTALTRWSDNSYVLPVERRVTITWRRVSWMNLLSTSSQVLVQVNQTMQCICFGVCNQNDAQESISWSTNRGSNKTCFLSVYFNSVYKGAYTQCRFSTGEGRQARQADCFVCPLPPTCAGRKYLIQ